MSVHIVHAVGHLERRCFGGRFEWQLEDPIFAVSEDDAEQTASDNGGDMAMERWSIEAETAEDALVALGNAMRGDQASVTRKILRRDGVGGEAW